MQKEGKSAAAPVDPYSAADKAEIAEPGDWEELAERSPDMGWQGNVGDDGGRIDIGWNEDEEGTGGLIRGSGSWNWESPKKQDLFKSSFQEGA